MRVAGGSLLAAGARGLRHQGRARPAGRTCRRRRSRTDGLMDHFTYRDGVLHAEDVPLPEIAAAVGTPVYVYSTATLTRHYRVFEEALAGLDHLICYAMKANSNLAVLRLMASLGAGHGRGLRGRVPPRAGRRGAGRADRLLRASARPGPRCGWRCSTASASSTSSPSPSFARCPRSRRASGAVAPIAIRVNPDVDARTHAKIATGKAENKFGIPIAPGARGLCRGGAAAGHRGRRHRRAHRQPADRARPVRGGLRQGGGADARRCAPTATTSGGSTSAAGSASPTGARNEAPPLPFDYGEVVRRTVGASRLRDRDRAGAADRRQRRRAAQPGDLPQARRGAGLPDPRRGDERPGPAGDVRRLARHRAGGRAGGRRRAGAGRRGRAGLRDRRHLRQGAAAAAARRPATSSPSARRAPTAR